MVQKAEVVLTNPAHQPRSIICELFHWVHCLPFKHSLVVALNLRASCTRTLQEAQPSWVANAVPQAQCLTAVSVGFTNVDDGSTANASDTFPLTFSVCSDRLHRRMSLLLGGVVKHRTSHTGARRRLMYTHSPECAPLQIGSGLGSTGL